jgi:hypothetical protein
VSTYDKEREFEGDEEALLPSYVRTYENERIIATTTTDEIKTTLFIKDVWRIFKHKAL